MRIFLDANILFSAAQPNSWMRDLVEYLFAQEKCLTSNYAVEEARRNLANKAADCLASFPRLLGKCEFISQLSADLEVGLPLKEVPILGGAIAGNATHLLTGDQKDFGKLWGKTVQGVKIVSPRMLAGELGLL